ncbi:MAG: CPBP family glutamic-type intramembrane protease [Planctomycetota bacterium]|jgi:membrane protease YdiL (CAAX protease family)
MPVLFVVALTLGLARQYSGSLVPCILLHAVYNLLVLI